MESFPQTLVVKTQKKKTASWLTGDNVSIAIMVVLCTSALFIFQCLIIGYGAANPEVICKSGCISYECKPGRDDPFALPTPAIGVKVSAWLIVGGVMGIILMFVAIAGCGSADSLTYTMPMQLAISGFLLSLLAFVWLIIGCLVYTQTVDLCTNYHTAWTIATTTHKWLLGMIISGFIFVVFTGHYFLSYISHMMTHWYHLQTCCKDSAPFHTVIVV
jgi:hypothetical protein